jgi:hypothetical protein
MELKRDPYKYYTLAMERGYENIVVPKVAPPKSYHDLRRFLDKHKPDVLVVDQIINLHFVKDNPTQNLEAAAQAMREIAKEYNILSLSITRAGGSAMGKLVLDYDDIQWSTVGVAATLDLAIGMGQNQEMKERNQVMLSFPKCKFQPIKPMLATIKYDLNQILA